MRGVGGVEPLKHFVRILASRIEHRDLECGTDRISGHEIVEGSIGCSSVALRLLNQRDCIVAPKTFGLQSGVDHRLLGAILNNIQQREVTVKTRSLWLNLEPFTEQFLSFLVAAQTHNNSSDVVPGRGAKRIQRQSFPASLLGFAQPTLSRERGTEVTLCSGVVGRRFQYTPELFFGTTKVEIRCQSQEAHRHSDVGEVGRQANCLLRSSTSLLVRFIRIVSRETGCVLAPSL